jgi:adenylate cyclase
MKNRTIHFSLKLLFTILFSLFTTFSLQAQTNLDSLYSVWQDEAQKDSVRATAYKDYIWEGFLFSNPDSAFVLAEDLVVFGKGIPKGSGTWI